MKKIPLTLLFGFPDTGKSAVLNHVLSRSEHPNLAALTHDAWVSDGHAGGNGHATAVPEAYLPTAAQAASRYKIPEALHDEMMRLVREENIDGLIFEAYGLAEPMTVVEAFLAEAAAADPGSDSLFLDTVVTVVDAGRFLDDIYASESLQQRGLTAAQDDVRSIAEVLIHQVEFANVIVLNKVNTLPQVEQERLVAALQMLNPQATVLPVQHGAVPPDKVVATGLFNFDQTSTAAGWLHAMRSEEAATTAGYGVSRFVYRSRCPFHSGRFYLFLRMAWPGVLRSKGVFWLVSEADTMWVWAQAGQTREYFSGGGWLATIPRTQWQHEDLSKAEIERIWHPEHGDRRQEIAFIGIDMNQEVLTQALDWCLLTNDERASASWQNDPMVESLFV